MSSTISPYITTERDFSFSFGGAFKKLVDLLLRLLADLLIVTFMANRARDIMDLH